MRGIQVALAVVWFIEGVRLKKSAQHRKPATRARVKDAVMDAVKDAVTMVSGVGESLHTRTRAGAKSSKREPHLAQVPEISFTLIQLADPQLGLFNYERKTEAKFGFNDEVANLEVAVNSIKRLKPKLVVMSGDMQNFWSQEVKRDGQANLFLKGVGDYGKVQAEAVKTVMQTLRSEDIKVVYTPGNHDLDDKMNMEDLKRYGDIWRPEMEEAEVQDLSEHGDSYFFVVNGVLFISMNSQLHYSDEVSAEVLDYREKQTERIKSWLMLEQGTIINSIVMLTHIPPFIGDLYESSGWANWQRTPGNRHDILGMLMDRNRKVSPELWLCGHFHANVRATIRINDRPVEIMTTGSVGSTMLWNYTEGDLRNITLKQRWMAKSYLPTHARRIAEAPTGFDAFKNYIVGGNMSNIPEQRDFKITPSRELSGLRVAQFYAGGGYRHKWFTLNEIEHIDAIDDESMQDAYQSFGLLSVSEQAAVYLEPEVA